jgi:hypothetical protein
VCFSCTNFSKRIDEKAEVLKFRCDTLRIETDTHIVGSLDVFDAFSDAENEILCSVYNDMLTLFDLKKAKLIKTIRLPFGGENGIARVVALKMKSPSEIFLQTEKDIVLINSEGNVLKRIKINTDDLHLLQNDAGFPLQIFREKLVLKQILRSKDAAEKNPFAVFIDPESQKREDTGIRYPVDLDALFSSYAFFSSPQLSVSGNIAVFNFPYSNEIFLYDFEKKTLLQNTLLSENTPAKAYAYKDGQDFEKYMAENPHYLKPLADVEKGLIFRPVWQKPNTDAKNPFLAKPFSLTVANTELKKIADITLPKKSYAPNMYFLTINALYFCEMHPESNMREDFLTLHRYSFWFESAE